MPAHDWARVDDGVFHDCHLAWIAELRRTLNQGVLPPGYYALSEQALSETYSRLQKRLVVRHQSNNRVVALIEVVSSGNKASFYPLEQLVNNALAALSCGIHLLILDLIPPGPRDPNGIHGLIWGELTGESYAAPADAPLTLAAYSAGLIKEAFVEPLAVGSPLIDMPLFLTAEEYIPVPLEATYTEAFTGLPAHLLQILES